jgi:membrane-associated phospholipid phosphatase
MEALYNLEINLILFLQSLGDWLIPLMTFFSFLGNEEFFLLIMPFVYWTVNPKVGLRLGALLLLSQIFNGYLKHIFGGPRPFWISSEVKAHLFESSFGLPSGHAMTATSVWGGLAASIGKRWTWAATTVLILLIALSRLFTAVHFLFDITAGLILGVLLLVVYFKFEQPLVRWFKSLSVTGQLSAALIFSLSMALVGVLVRFTLGAHIIPVEWITTAAALHPDEPINPLSLSGNFSNTGAFFGMIVGAVLLPLFGGFQVEGPLWKKILRFVIGIAGVLLIWRGLGLVLPGGENIIGYIFRFLRYGLIGFWIIGLAPLVFTTTGLASKSPAITDEKQRAEVRL